MAIDKLAQMLEMDFNQEKFSAYFAKKKIDGEDIILLKPTTYMNNRVSPNENAWVFI